MGSITVASWNVVDAGAGPLAEGRGRVSGASRIISFCTQGAFCIVFLSQLAEAVFAPVLFWPKKRRSWSKEELIARLTYASEQVITITSVHSAAYLRVLVSVPFQRLCNAVKIPIRDGNAMIWRIRSILQM